MVELYKTSDKDIKLIGELLFNEKDEYRKYFDPFDNRRELIESHNNKFNIFYTIYLSNNVAGFVMLRGLDLDQKRFGIYISSKYSSKGYSKIVISKFIEIIKSNYKIKKIHLKVNKKNKKALNLYHNFGFKVIKEDNDEYIMCFEI